MTARQPLPESVEAVTLSTILESCPACGSRMLSRYHNRRRVHVLRGILDMRLQIRRCQNQLCLRFKKPHRPEMETRLALPGCKFGLDVIADLVAQHEDPDHRISRIRDDLIRRGIPISLRTVRNLPNLYRKLKEGSIAKDGRVLQRLSAQGYVVLDLFWVRWDAGKESRLFIVRDFVSGHILRGRYIHADERFEFTDLIAEVRDTLQVPIYALVSDQKPLIREAIPLVFGNVPNPRDYCLHIPFTTAPHPSQQPSYALFFGDIIQRARVARNSG